MLNLLHSFQISDLLLMLLRRQPAWTELGGTRRVNILTDVGLKRAKVVTRIGGVVGAIGALNTWLLVLLRRILFVLGEDLLNQRLLEHRLLDLAVVLVWLLELRQGGLS